jgi:asparagine synthase (glutamine-hydrolysing)
MSGFAALLHLDNRPADPGAVGAMLSAAAYRGPDGLHVLPLGPIVLGHARMVVTPEDERERQPIVSARTGFAIVADVRLDNRAELLGRLPDRPAPEAGDAELILRAYEAWGTEGFARLLGDFAAVIWDPRARRLLCVRDTNGQRTLFYRAGDRAFAAASEIHQLLQDPAVPVEPDEESIRNFLVPLNMLQNEKDQAATFFRGIFAVNAGHVLTVDAEGVRSRRYREPAPPAELRYRTDQEYAEHYRALLAEVVRARLRTAGPAGALLSGGLDSSSIVCTAQEEYRAGRAADRGFVSYSLVFDALDCDERGLIEDVQAKYGFDARYLQAGQLDGRLDLQPRGFRESPNVGVLAQRDAVCGAAVSDGVRMLLTGDLADACVGGSPLVFDSLLRSGQVAAFLRRLRAYRRTSNERLRTIVARDCLAPLLPLAVQKRVMTAYVRRQVDRFRPALLPAWMPAALRENLVERHLALCLAAERERRYASPARHWEYGMLSPPEITRHPTPWPVEIWRPFADRRLHEFLLAIPPEQKFAPHPDTDEYYAASKSLVRRSMRGIVPESIRTRTSKTFFDAVFEHELERAWPAFEAAFGPAARPEIARYGLVDPRQFWARLEHMRGDLHGPDAVYILQVVALESWLRIFRLERSQRVTVSAARPGGPPLRVEQATVAEVRPAATPDCRRKAMEAPPADAVGSIT